MTSSKDFTKSLAFSETSPVMSFSSMSEEWPSLWRGLNPPRGVSLVPQRSSLTHLESSPQSLSYSRCLLNSSVRLE